MMDAPGLPSLDSADRPAFRYPEIGGELYKQNLDKRTHGQRKIVRAQTTPAEQEHIYGLRNAFRKALSKLSVNDTKEIAMRELMKLVELNVTQPALRVFLSALGESNKPVSLGGKEAQVRLLGHIVCTFKQSLLDPLDKPPNLLKTVVRVTEILQRCLKENSAAIHHSCAESMLKLYEFCTPGIEAESANILYYLPLEAIISGGTNKFAQTGAAHCLLAFFAFLKSKEQTELLNFFMPNFLQLFLVLALASQPE